MTTAAQPCSTERRKPHIVDLRPLYSTTERRETLQLLGLENSARQYIAFTIKDQPQ